MDVSRVSRFLAPVDMVNGQLPTKEYLGPCWEWRGRLSRLGYPLLRNMGYRYGHELTWRRHHGTIPRGKTVDHKCHNPACVCPWHLFLRDRIDGW
jgi:hypothetical protein